MGKTILNIAATPDDFIELSLDEKAWAVLNYMKATQDRHHSTNLMLGLASTYDEPLHHGQPTSPIRKNDVRSAMAEALNRLVTLGLVALDFEQPATFHFVTCTSVQFQYVIYTFVTCTFNTRACSFANTLKQLNA